MRYFVAVAEEMHIHRAAERLNISQPPLSLTIKQLEEELGVYLFERVGRGIQITRAGKDFLTEAKDIMLQVDKASKKVKDVEAGHIGVIKIGFISSAITGVLQKLVKAHRREYPRVIIEMNQFSGNSIIEGVLNKDFDIGIDRIPLYYPDQLQKHDIVKESWYLAIPKDHDYARKERVKINELADQELIFYPRWNSPSSYDDVMQLFKQHEIIPNIVQEATEQMTIAGLVGSGMGIGIVPECMKKVKVENVVHRPLAGTTKRTGFTLLQRKEKDVLVDQFIDLAKKIDF